MNKCILSGNLCRDVELKQTTGGKSVVTNCVAVQREFKGANGEYESDFIDIVVWDKAAEYLAKYAKKGDRVELCGRWTVRKYTANDGTNRVVNECTVESIKAFRKDEPKADNKPSMPSAYTGNNSQYEEITDIGDLPF